MSGSTQTNSPQMLVAHARSSTAAVRADQPLLRVGEDPPAAAPGMLQLLDLHGLLYGF